MARKKKVVVKDVQDDLVAPKRLAKRWDCARASVDRVAKRHGWRKYFLGEGENGMVRYRWIDVLELEAERSLKFKDSSTANSAN